MPERSAGVRHNVPVSRPDTTRPLTPYVDLSRSAWARLRANMPLSLTDADLTRLRGLADRVDLAEVEEIYLPISRLLNFRVAASERLRRTTASFLGEEATPIPFIIGVAGSVAVGKSTTARLLRELLTRWPETPRVDLVTTDGFLLPNAELERRGLMQRKGFPESYDRGALLRFVSEVKSGVAEVRAPVYSHLTYDIVPDEFVQVSRPDVLIVEGLNVLQMPQTGSGRRSSLAVSDFFDFSVYVHASTVCLRQWYVERFFRLRETAFADPQSYFHRYAALSDDQARETALGIWSSINEPNLRQNIRPTRGRADLVLSKDEHHAVSRVRLRKI